MNPAMLALSAANPGLLPLAVLGTDQSGFGGLSYGRRPVRYESDEETLQRVERAYAERERAAAEKKRREDWLAVPGNLELLARQNAAVMLVYEADRDLKTHEAKQWAVAKAARRNEANDTVVWVRRRFVFVLTALVVLAFIALPALWAFAALVAALFAGSALFSVVSMEGYIDPEESENGPWRAADLYSSFISSFISPFGDPGPDFPADIEHVEARARELAQQYRAQIDADAVDAAA